MYEFVKGIQVSTMTLGHGMTQHGTTLVIGGGRYGGVLFRCGFTLSWVAGSDLADKGEVGPAEVRD